MFSRQPILNEKKYNAETLNTIQNETAPLAKLPPEGFKFIS